MKKNIILSLLVICTFSLSAQIISWDEFYNFRNQSAIWGGADFIPNSPYGHGDKKGLPAKVDNSENIFLPPVLNQGNTPSCQQYSGVGYALNYEMNHINGTSGYDSLNYMPPEFTYQLLLDGYAWNGISMFSSLNIAKYMGHPFWPDFMLYGDTLHRKWMSGYDKWYRAMHNRIHEFYRFDISTTEGQEKLKHWLWNHSGTSLFGGVALFNANSPWNRYFLPPESDEAGKQVVVSWAGNATHGMTIVGYNDSICFDYNDDGLFTTDIDINDDGIIDIRDSEYGAFKVVNSYGIDWADSGYFYSMYKAMASEYPNGGVWNHEAVILDMKENYTPLLTARYKIKSTHRGTLKYTVGFATDPNMNHPEFVLDLPVFRYQGGPFPMQGYSYEGDDVFEGGFDLTPFLSWLPDSGTGKFFLIINSLDNAFDNNGEILEFEIIDYRNNSNFISDETPLPIVHNRMNIAGVEVSAEAQGPEIIADDHYTISGKEEIQLQAQNGTPPYTFCLNTSYSVNYSDKDFPEISGDEITDPNHIPVELPFDFPFYDSSYRNITVSPAGHIMFGEKYHPWPYCVNPDQAFQHARMISVFLAPWYLYNQQGDGIYADISDQKATFFWVSKAEYSELNFDILASITLFPDGTVELQYGGDQPTVGASFVAGVSAGDNNRFTYAFLENHNFASLYYENVPEGISLGSDGLISFSDIDDGRICNLPVKVGDMNGLTDEKTISLSSSFGVKVKFHSENADHIIAGEPAFGDLIIYPGSFTGDLNTTITSSSEYIYDLTPGDIFSVEGNEPIILENYFSFYPGITTPDRYNASFNITLNEQQLEITIPVSAPKLDILSLSVNDNDDEMLSPGEVFFLRVNISNMGSSDASNLDLELSCDSDHVYIIEAQKHIHLIKNGSYNDVLMPVQILPEIVQGEKVSFTVSLSGNSEELLSEQFNMYAGKRDAVVINMSSQVFSADSLLLDLQQENILADYETSITEDINKYRAAFICFGGLQEPYTLTSDEQNYLLQYIHEGGKLYFEGNRIWYDDYWTNVHNNFRVQTSPSSWYSVNPFVFQGDTLSYTMPPARLNYILIPQWPVSTKAFALDGESLMCYRDYSDIKTIASSLLYGFIEDYAENEKVEIVRSMIDFFDLGKQEYSADFLSDKDTLRPGEPLLLMLNTNRYPDQISWNIEGGPVISGNSLYGTVSWDVPGDYDVECTLIYPDTTVTIVKENYIHVIDDTGTDVFSDSSPLVIFPNPAKDNIILSFRNQKLSSDYRWQIADLSGKVMLSGYSADSYTSIDISALAKGTYLFIVADNSQQYFKKIVRQ